MRKAGKSSAIFSLTAVIAIAVILASLAYWSKDFQKNIPLNIPGQEISVECEYVVSTASERLQEVIDKPAVAAWHDNYIMDHAGQSFDGLWNTRVGEEIVFGTRHYKCSFVTTGWSNHGIEAHNREEKLPNADLYLCTCIPGGEEYEIYIVGAERS